MTDADLFAGEITLATGETVPVPSELLAAIQDACPAPIEARGAVVALSDVEGFARRFIAALFARDLLLVARGRPISKETVGVDAYSLVCSQKHALQRQIAGMKVPPPPAGNDNLRGDDPPLTRRQWWGLVAITLAIAALVGWRFA